MYLAKLNEPSLSFMNKTRNINNLKQRHLFTEPIVEPTIDYAETSYPPSLSTKEEKDFQKRLPGG